MLWVNLEIGNWNVLNASSSNGDKRACIPNKGCEPSNTNPLQDHILPQQEHILTQQMTQQQPYQYQSQNSYFDQQKFIQRQARQPAESTMISTLPTLQPSQSVQTIHQIYMPPTLPSSRDPSQATNSQNFSLLQRQVETRENAPLEHVFWQTNNPLLHELQMEPSFLREMYEPKSSQQFQNVAAQQNQLLQSQGGLPILSVSKKTNVPTLGACSVPTLNWKENMNQKVYQNLLREIHEINQKLQYTTVSIENEDANQVTNSPKLKSVIIRFSTKTIDPDPKKNFLCIPKELARECHLRLLISPFYPNWCPYVLGTIPTEKWCVEASFIFNKKVNAIQKPFSVGIMVILWESSCQQVIIRIAKQCITRSKERMPLQNYLSDE